MGYLAAVGIKLKMRPLERAALFSAWGAKKLRGVCVCANALYGNAATRMSTIVPGDGTYAYGGYPDIDAMYKQQARETDRRKREALLHQIQSLLHDRGALRAHLGVHLAERHRTSRGGARADAHQPLSVVGAPGGGPPPAQVTAVPGSGSVRTDPLPGSPIRNRRCMECEAFRRRSTGLHKARGHPDLLPAHRQRILEVLAGPDRVRRSARSPPAHLFSRWYSDVRRGQHVVVAVEGEAGRSAALDRDRLRDASARGGRHRMATKLAVHRDADILYLTSRHPYPEQGTEELGDDVICRVNPHTGDIESLEILFFSRRRPRELLELPVIADSRRA